MELNYKSFHFSFRELSNELVRLDLKRKESDNQAIFSAISNMNRTKTNSFSTTSFKNSSFDASKSYETVAADTENKFLSNDKPNKKINQNTNETKKVSNPTRNNNNNQPNDYLEFSLSPKSVENNRANNNRSHDGVFLRPDAVSNQSSHTSTTAAATLSSMVLVTTSTTPTMASLLSNRLIKRTSIDSGINMDSPSLLRSMTRAGKQQQNRDHLMKLNRFDRSMSLPISHSPFLTFNSSNSITTAASLASAAAAASAAGIDSAIDSFSLSIDSAIDPNSFYSNNGSNTSLSNASIMSPPRRMDFALCKCFTIYY